MNIYHLLGSNGFWVVNKKLAKKVGIDAAILIADLISKRQYFIENSDIKIDEFFFNTRENIEIDTTLTAFQQRAAERILVEEGFLVVEIKGLPAKNYYKVVDSKLLSFFTTGSKESSQQEVKKLDGNNNTEIIIKKNNKDIKPKFSFKNSLENYGFDAELVAEWMQVRKTKKATNTKTAFDNFISEIEKRSCDINQTLRLIVSKSWSGFRWDWVDNDAPKPIEIKPTYKKL